jgi:ABC-type multidrug transport system fused ATPase/permease subunit
MEDLRYVARYLHGYRLDILVATLLIMGETVAELVIPFLMARIVDVGIASGSLALVLATGRRMVVVALLAGVCGLGYSHFSAKAAMGFGANLREAEYAHLQEYAFANLDEFESSSLVTRLTTDITVIQNAFVMGVRPLLRSPVMLVAGLVLACAMSARLAVVFFVILPFLAVALGLIVHHVAPQYAVLQGVMDRLNETLQEDLVAIRAIKAYVREGHVAKRFEDVNAALADTATHTFGGAVLNMPAFQAAMAVTNVGLLWFGGQMVSSGEIGVGTLTGFMSYVLLIMNSLNMISSVFLLLARAVTSVGRVCEVLREKPAMDPNPTGAKEVTDGSVELRDVSFKYSATARRNVLEHVSLRFEPGSTVGILGGTGSGKSSLVQLLPRLYDATEGAVLRGRARRARLRRARPARGRGDGAPEERALLGHRTRQPALGQPRGDGPGDLAGVPRRVRGRVPGPHRRARRGPGTRRGQRLWRAEAAPVHSAHAAGAPQGDGVRRLHQRRGHRDGRPHTRGARTPARRDEGDHRAARELRHGRGPDRDLGRRARARNGDACAAACERPHLPGTLSLAKHRGG